MYIFIISTAALEVFSSIIASTVNSHEDCNIPNITIKPRETTLQRHSARAVDSRFDFQIAYYNSKPAAPKKRFIRVTFPPDKMENSKPIKLTVLRGEIRLDIRLYQFLLSSNSAAAISGRRVFDSSRGSKGAGEIIFPGNPSSNKRNFTRSNLTLSGPGAAEISTPPRNIGSGIDIQQLPASSRRFPLA